MGGLEGVFGVERAFAPGGLPRAVLVGEEPGSLLAGLEDRGRDRGPRVRVGVEEGPGDACPPADGGDADLGFLPA